MNLWLYFLLVFGVVALPGLDMAFVVASTLGGGFPSGMSAVAGICCGGIVHVLITGIGLATLVVSFPALFDVFLIVGALYIAWVGIGLLRVRSLVVAYRMKLSPAASWRRGILTSLTNPKAYAFMLAIFPQFIHPAAGPIAAQALGLATIGVGTQIAVYGTVVVATRAMGGAAGSASRGGLLAVRSIGGLLILMSIMTLISSLGAVASTSTGVDPMSTPEAGAGPVRGASNGSSPRGQER